MYKEVLKLCGTAVPPWEAQSVKHLPSAQVITPGLAPRAFCSVGSLFPPLPLPGASLLVLSLSLSLSSSLSCQINSF